MSKRRGTAKGAGRADATGTARAETERDDLGRKLPEHTPEEKRDIIARVCERIARPMTVLEAIAEETIDRVTLWRWLADDPDLRALFREARVWQAHAYAEECITLADQSTDRDTAAAQRVKVDTRKWFTSKIAGKIYGDRREVHVKGKVKHQHSPAAREQRITDLAAALRERAGAAN